MKFFLVVLAALSCGSMSTFAATITVQLNPSNESYTLNGTGGSNGYATYLAQQGTCTAGATTTTCQLTGTYTGSTTGYTSGSYTLLTSYNNADGGLQAISTTPVNSSSGGNYFTLLPPSSDVNVSLLLDDISGLTTLPLVVDGVNQGATLLFTATNSVCSGLDSGVACTQGNVGMSNSASISSPVSILVNYDPSVALTPEPGWLALTGIAPGAFVALRRRLRRNRA